MAVAGIDITKVIVNKVKEPKSNTVGFASISLNEAVVLRNLRIVNGPNGLFVSPPSQKKEQEGAKAEYEDHFFFMDRDLRDLANKSILDEYAKAR